MVWPTAEVPPGSFGWVARVTEVLPMEDEEVLVIMVGKDARFHRDQIVYLGCVGRGSGIGHPLETDGMHER